jgi:hypothetical protein
MALSSDESKDALDAEQLYHGKDDEYSPTADSLDHIVSIEALKAVDASAEKPTNKPATFGELFCVADTQDKCYIGTAFFMAFLSGCNQPAQLIIFGSILTAFNGATPAESVKLVSLLAGLYAVMGFQMFLSSFAQTA